MSAKTGYVEPIDFTCFAKDLRLNHIDEVGRKKEIFHKIKVLVVMEPV